MAPTTLTAFVNAVEALSITGVVKTFQGPPASLSTAQLPAAWVRSASISGGPSTRGVSGGWPILRCELIVATCPIVQGMQDDGFVAAVAMVDAIKAALNSAAGKDLAGVAPTCDAGTGYDVVAGTTYRAVIATIEAAG